MGISAKTAEKIVAKSLNSKDLPEKTEERLQGIVHPRTKERLLGKQWAARYKVPYGTFRGWQMRFDLEYLFLCLDSGVQPLKRAGRNPNMWQHPVTKVTKTARDWADLAFENPRMMLNKLGKEGAEALLDYPELLAIAANATDSLPNNVLTLAEKQAIEKRGVVTYSHPKTGVTLPLYAWARQYGVEVSEFYRQLRRVNGDLRRLFEYFDVRKKYS